MMFLFFHFMFHEYNIQNFFYHQNSPISTFQFSGLQHSSSVHVASTINMTFNYPQHAAMPPHVFISTQFSSAFNFPLPLSLPGNRNSSLSHRSNETIASNYEPLSVLKNSLETWAPSFSTH